MMAKIQNLSELSQSFSFTEYDFFDFYRRSFERSELGRIKKLLWECCEKAYKTMCEASGRLGIRRPRTKYLDVEKANLGYAKQRKHSKSQTRSLTRRLLQLLGKLLKEIRKMEREHADAGVLTDKERRTMTNYVNSQSTYRCDGNSDSIAKALASGEGWNTSNYDCTPGKTPESNNATGFTAVPAGNRNGSFYDAGVGAYFWSATQEVSDPDKVHYRVLLFGDPNVSNYREYKNVGFSVRCLRD